MNWEGKGGGGAGFTTTSRVVFFNTVIDIVIDCVCGCAIKTC